MPYFWKTKILLAKSENVYGNDPTLLAASGMLARDVSLVPMDGGEEIRDLETGFMVKAMLAITAGDVSGLGALATLASVDTAQIVNLAVTTAKLAANAVTNPKLAQMAAGTIKGNNGGALADPNDLTAAQVKAILAIAAGDVSGLGALATLNNINRADIVNGAVTAARILDGDVGNIKLANMGANTIKGNPTGASAVPTNIFIGPSKLFGRGSTGDLTPIDLGTNLSMSGTTLNAAGGSGSPGGSTTQVQYNSAGAFAGAAEVEIENNQLRLEATTSLTPPAAGGVKLIGRADVGRTLPAFLSENGLVNELQASLARSAALIWKAMPNNSALSALGGGVPTATGTATAAVIATTNLVTYTPRLEYLVTVAATTAIAGFRGVATLASVGGPSAGLGGFAFVGRWGPATGVATATNRAFFGLANITSAPTDVEPSTSVNCVFMGWDAADTNIQLMHNDAAGTCTKIDLGASFPVPTTDRAALYELSLYSPRGATQSVEWKVTDLITGAVASGTISTNLPSTSTLLAPRGWMSVGGTSSVIGIGVNSVCLDPLLS